MKKSRQAYITICISLILFFSSACICTQCLKTNPGSALNTSLDVETTDTFELGKDKPDLSSGVNDNSQGAISGEEINFKITYKFLVQGDTDSIVFTTGIPKDYRNRQKIKDYGFSSGPEKIFTDGDNKYAVFEITSPVNSFYITLDIRMELFDFDLLAAQKIPNNRPLDKSISAGYLIPEEHIEADSPAIKATAEYFTGNSQAEIVRQTYNFVLDRMQYCGYNPSDIGAAKALETGSGDCTEYSDLFAALCRAKGIPARVIEGYSTDSGPSDISYGHNWTEVYLDDFGWVPFDPTYDDNNGNSLETTFENLKNIYVYTGFKRNDDILYNYHYYAYNYYGDAIEVEKTITVN